MMVHENDVRFIEYIADLSRDTGSRAALRSGLGRSVNQAERMHAYLAPWTSSSRPHQEAVRYTIASLIAHNPDAAMPSTSPGNIGVSLARYTTLAAATREASVHLLSRQPASLLCRMLTRVVVPLRADDIAVDFAVLLHDATWWPRQQKDTARRWLQAYYRADRVGPVDDYE